MSEDVYNWLLVLRSGTIYASGYCSRTPVRHAVQESSSGRRGVSIGDSLATARSQAGLTVTQVSQRTCIRETIIRGIERSDFSACGGDFYARGHIRSIARAVGADDEELIREYDALHGAPRAVRAADVFEPATPIKIKERRAPNWTLAMAVVLVLILGYGVYRAVNTATPGSAVAGRGTRAVAASHRPSGKPSPAPPSVSASPAQVAEVIGSVCDMGHCLKRRLWTVTGMPVDAAAAKSIIPCLEPCAVLMESARKALRTSQQEIPEPS